ncbi:MAG: 30S ribosomal protein S6 [Actinomycetaceae bacterium]|nr:30S ribosomal protein S6 [Actinomycetaceae bacterium]
MREYEMMIILDPDVDDRNLSDYVDGLLKVIPEEGGELKNVDIWGKRRLAYEIKKNSEAIYVVVDMAATPAMAKELDRQLSLNESVLRTKLMRKED